MCLYSLASLMTEVYEKNMSIAVARSILLAGCDTCGTNLNLSCSMKKNLSS